ncbi:hypothetical protein SmJEL517_g04423 [Synchytrium microbalum]|uniref:Major facilitator superfamily (MFS) profile domain-containing protein n=1 Tax=Synchytrium microbalum TaxID=1806994 RepID=A0A507BZ64_9FUNG|nr:uncharacterized protein SmJEL517_g04423 [Synchytrium microbalum]TPX32398.1 hypothetical protein SmJEL517_g04423 [Synchytrium microbalum]
MEVESKDVSATSTLTGSQVNDAEKARASLEAEHENEQLEFKFVGTMKWYTITLAFTGLIIGQFLAALDATIITTALNTIAADLNAVNEVSWVATGYIMTYNSFQPLLGKFSHIFGHKAIIGMGIVCFIIGSAMAGFSPNIITLILARAIQGVGGAGILSMVIITISDMFPLETRAKYLAIPQSVFGIATIVGPLIGGAFTDKLSWRWNFWINIPLGLVALPLVLIYLPLPIPKSKWSTKLARVDFLGTFVLIAFVIAILLPTSWGGTTYPWSSPIIIALYCVAFVFGIVFIIIEWKFAAEPIVPLRLFKNYNTSLIFAVAFFQGSAFYCWIFYSPYYYAAVNGDSATISGLQLLPLLLGLTIFSVVSIFSLPLVRFYNVYVILGNIMVVAGTALFSTLDETASRGQQIGYMLMVGAGLGFSLQVQTLLLQASVDQSDVAIVSGLTQFFQSIGGGIGLAVLSALFTNSLTSQFSALPANVLAGLATWNQRPASLHSLPADISGPTIHAYTQALRQIFIYGTPFAAAAAFLSILLIWKRVPKSGVPKTEAVAMG